jgi:hypothetical protein
MGSSIVPPGKSGSSEESTEGESKLGELLGGRLAEVDVDSVEVVREEREP